MRLRFLILCLTVFPAAASAQEHGWERLGPPGGMVMTLEASPVSGVVYLGTPDGHVFVSTDAAQHWQLRGRVGTRTDAVISRLLADPSQSDVVYAAVWYQQAGLGGGVFRSDDAGWSWNSVGLQQEAVRALEIASAKPLSLVAGTRSGVFRFELARQNWERISPLGDEEIRNVDSVAVDPHNPNVIYAGTYHLPWKTIDGGKVWNPVTAGLIDDSDIMSLRIDTSNPTRLFLSACSGIYRSENQGAQWTKLQGIPYASRRTHSILQDPQRSQTLYAATTEGLWITRDSGETWKRTTTKDWVVNSVLVLPPLPGGSERVLLGTEAYGIMVSEDGGESFSASNAGFTHQVVKQFLADPADSKHMLMVMQQRGPKFMESRDAGSTWTPLSLLTKEEKLKSAAFAVQSVDRLYASPWGWLARLQNGQLWLFETKSETWREWKLYAPINSAPTNRTTPRNNASRKSASPIKITSSDNTIGFSQSDVFLSSRKGLLRCKLDGTCGSLKAFARVPSLNALYVSLDGSHLVVAAKNQLGISRDGGESASWRDLPSLADSVLWVDFQNRSTGNRLLLGTSNGLYFSLDDAVTWARQEGGLPAGQVENWLSSPDFVAATLRDGGIYLSSDDSKTWRRIDWDAERSRFVGMVEPETGMIVVGSQSEGILRWQNRLGNDSPK